MNHIAKGMKGFTVWVIGTDNCQTLYVLIFVLAEDVFERSFQNTSYNKDVKESVKYLIIWINKYVYQSVE